MDFQFSTMVEFYNKKCVKIKKVCAFVSFSLLLTPTSSHHDSMSQSLNKDSQLSIRITFQRVALQKKNKKSRLTTCHIWHDQMNIKRRKSL